MTLLEAMKACMALRGKGVQRIGPEAEKSGLASVPLLWVNPTEKDIMDSYWRWEMKGAEMLNPKGFFADRFLRVYTTSTDWIVIK